MDVAIAFLAGIFIGRCLKSLKNREVRGIVVLVSGI